MYIPVLVYYYASSNPLEGEAVQGETVEARQVSKATSNDGHAATSGFSAQLIDDLDTDNQFPCSPSITLSIRHVFPHLTSLFYFILQEK